MSKPRIAVVFGGRNSEHAVSLMGAGSVLEAIDRDKYEVIPVGIAQDGRWVLAAWGELGIGLGVASVISVTIPYTVPERLNAFSGAAPGQGGQAFAASIGGMF